MYHTSLKLLCWDHGWPPPTTGHPFFVPYKPYIIALGSPLIMAGRHKPWVINYHSFQVIGYVGRVEKQTYSLINLSYVYKALCWVVPPNKTSMTFELSSFENGM